MLAQSTGAHDVLHRLARALTRKVLLQRGADAADPLRLIELRGAARARGLAEPAGGVPRAVVHPAVLSWSWSGASLREVLGRAPWQPMEPV